jgi:hypothetical protein
LVRRCVQRGWSREDGPERMVRRGWSGEKGPTTMSKQYFWRCNSRPLFQTLTPNLLLSIYSRDPILEMLFLTLNPDYQSRDVSGDDGPTTMSEQHFWRCNSRPLFHTLTPDLLLSIYSRDPVSEMLLLTLNLDYWSGEVSGDDGPTTMSEQYFWRCYSRPFFQTLTPDLLLLIYSGDSISEMLCLALNLDY